MNGEQGVLVVGAGPAGSAAALVLARAGVRVRLVDRATFPRDKLCGDTLNPGAVSVLDRLGVGVRVRAHGQPLTGMLLTGPNRAAVAVDYPADLPGVALWRRDLDVLLLAAAIEAGADFLPGVAAERLIVDGSGPRVCGVGARLTGRRRSFEMRADLVIAADGRASRLARAAGLARVGAEPRRWAFGTHFDGVEGLGTRGEMHVRGDGYIGVAPLGGIANVCVVRDRHFLQRAGMPAREVLARAVAGDRLLSSRLRGATQVGPVRALGPLSVRAVGPGRAGLLLAGDAAGFIDPMTGDGLRFALRGGELAAEAVLFEFAAGRPAHAWLRRARRREFAGKWRLNRALRRLVASPRSVALAAALATRWPAPFEFLVRSAADLAVARAWRRASGACS